MTSLTPEQRSWLGFTDVTRFIAIYQATRPHGSLSLYGINSFTSSFAMVLVRRTWKGNETYASNDTALTLSKQFDMEGGHLKFLSFSPPLGAVVHSNKNPHLMSVRRRCPSALVIEPQSFSILQPTTPTCRLIFQTRLVISSSHSVTGLSALTKVKDATRPAFLVPPPLSKRVHSHHPYRDRHDVERDSSKPPARRASLRQGVWPRCQLHPRHMSHRDECLWVSTKSSQQHRISLPLLYQRHHPRVSWVPLENMVLCILHGCRRYQRRPRLCRPHSHVLQPIQLSCVPHPNQ